MKILSTLIVMAGLAAVPAVQAQGCCSSEKTAGSGTCPMQSTSADGCEAHHGKATMTGVDAKASSHLAKPVQAVFDNYLKVQSALAGDSLKGVSAAASAIAKDAQAGDAAKMLPAKVAQQAAAVAQAKDLDAARAAFKDLSASLVGYLKDQKATGTYRVAYCPMAKASWVQTGETIVNPYMGKSMIHCGEIRS